MVTVGINAHLLFGGAGYRRAGIHHYIEQLLRHLPIDSQIRYTVWAGREGGLPPAPGLTIRASRWPTHYPPVRIAWEQAVWPWAARWEGVDILHSMAFVTPMLSGLPSLVTVYDLSFVHFPERFPAAKRLYLRTQARRSCRRARRVITISEATRRDIHDYFDIPWERIAVVRPGVDETFRPRSQEEVAAFRARVQAPARFILHVGTLQPRKNLLTLLEAFGRIQDPDLTLVLVGGKGWLYEEIFQRIQQLGLHKRVLLTGYVPDEDLPLWYNAADLLVFPSVYEGFGLPVAQAMACGAPVIAANTSSIPEVVGEAAYLFDPLDVTALTEAIRQVLAEATFSAELRSRGLARAQQFSWHNSAAALAAIYHQVALEGL